jgi:site-specific DNA recombinase
VKTIAYIRVSTDKQADHGISLEAQEAKVRAYAALYDLELIGIEIDAGESASTLERPALQRALRMLRTKKAKALLVVKLDRLTRSVRDLADLVDTYFASGKCALLSVTEQVDTRTAGGRMVLTILTTIGQWEREVIGERTSVAMAHLHAQGKRTSRFAPYGFRYADGVLETDPHEQAILARARELRGAGLALRAIASTLEEAGYVNREGQPFGVGALGRMCGAGDTPL